MFKVLGEENVGDYFFMHFRRIVDFGDDALTEYCGNVVWCVGLAVFLVNAFGNVYVLALPQLHIEYLTLNVS
jgi:hypothetical protein